MREENDDITEIMMDTSSSLFGLSYCVKRAL